jgi:regulatory protein
VKRPPPPPNARTAAVRLLARREYGRQELLQRLLQRGTARDEATAALDDLEQRGLLSDSRYAEALVSQMRARNRTMPRQGSVKPCAARCLSLNCA